MPKKEGGKESRRERARAFVRGLKDTMTDHGDRIAAVESKLKESAGRPAPVEDDDPPGALDWILGEEEEEGEE